jgi:hypothetical protein
MQDIAGFLECAKKAMNSEPVGPSSHLASSRNIGAGACSQLRDHF